MNAWPSLGEWARFGGVLALELVVVFAAAKLVSLRLRSATWRRALWQMTLLALLLVTLGELNGVRGWLRLPEKKVAPPSERRVVVTFQDAEPDWAMFRDQLASEAAPLVSATPKPAPRPSRWQQHTSWPALVWAVVAALILFRLLIAQVMALVLRVGSHRRSGQPCPLNVVNAQETADMAVRSTDAVAARARVIAQSLGIRRPVALLTNVRAVAPFTFGVWRPVIVLPRRFASAFTREQQDAALAHELAHVAGLDSAWRVVSQLACAVLWWHPLVWLAKRELDHASELVADEASLLVTNGPDRLAECLVACAKELRRPALTAWLGMDGGGFRSALGKRVNRLLLLDPRARLSRPVPWYLRLLAPVICVALLWLGMAAVMKSGEPHGSVWRASILGSAFAAAAEIQNEATTKEQREKLLRDLKEKGLTYEASRQAEVSKLVQDGKLFYETGRLAEARTNLQAALRLDPTNQTATWYLDAIGKVQSPTNSIKRPVSPKRQAIYDKLRSIRLSEWGPMDSLPLGEVIRGLSDAARRNDPDHKGVNFILSGNAVPNPGGVDPNGLPFARTNEPVDLKDMVIRLQTVIKNPTLEEALNIAVKIVDEKIKYSVEDYGVLISPAGNEPTPLHTRFFHMGSNDFQRALQSMPQGLTNSSAQTPSSQRAQASGTNGLSFLSEPTAAEKVIPVVQSWFKSVGVELTQPGKAVFYNDKLGLLIVRATLDDLDTIEKALQPFGVKSGTGFSEVMQLEAARLVQAGKSFYESGQLQAARTNLQAALRFSPTNQGALHYLDLVNARELAVRAKLKELNMEPMDAWTNQVQEASTTNLQTRFFSVDPKTLEQGLKSLSTQGGGGRGGNGERKPLFNPYDTNSVIERVQRLFQAAGVDLSAPGRTLIYQDRVGVVMVRATPAELDTVEKAVQLLNMTPPQLEIRVKVMEVERKPGDNFDWFSGVWLTNDVRASRRMAGRPVVTSSGDAIPAEMLGPGVRLRDPRIARPGVPSLTGILSDQQFRAALRALEKNGGTDLLSAPTITTMSGRQAQIKVVDIKYIVTDLDYSAITNKKVSLTNVSAVATGGGVGPLIMPIAEPFELGPVIDVVPYVMADGHTIQMTVIPTLKEFLGYDEQKDVWATGGPYAKEPSGLPAGVLTPVPLPKFRLRQVATSAMVWDGQTLVIGAGSARTMQRDRDASGVITTNFTEKELIYFITPRLIDAAGNPLHSDEEFPERHKTVPAQRNGGGKP